MTTAIDTNILLDILIPDEKYILLSKILVDKYKERGKLLICEIVYSELASQFPSSKDLERFLDDTGIQIQPPSGISLSIAGERWKEYASKRTNVLQCPGCGKKLSLSCPGCGNTISHRQHIINDFIIGANALTHADLLLSRDRGFYKTHFNDLVVKDKDYL